MSDSASLGSVRSEDAFQLQARVIHRQLNRQIKQYGKSAIDQMPPMLDCEMICTDIAEKVIDHEDNVKLSELPNKVLKLDLGSDLTQRITKMHSSLIDHEYAKAVEKSLKFRNYDVIVAKIKFRKAREALKKKCFINLVLKNYERAEAQRNQEVESEESEAEEESGEPQPKRLRHGGALVTEQLRVDRPDAVDNTQEPRRILGRNGDWITEHIRVDVHQPSAAVDKAQEHPRISVPRPAGTRRNVVQEDLDRIDMLDESGNIVVPEVPQAPQAPQPEERPAVDQLFPADLDATIEPRRGSVIDRPPVRHSGIVPPVRDLRPEDDGAVPARLSDILLDIPQGPEPQQTSAVDDLADIQELLAGLDVLFTEPDQRELLNIGEGILQDDIVAPPETAPPIGEPVVRDDAAPEPVQRDLVSPRDTTPDQIIPAGIETQPDEVVGRAGPVEETRAEEVMLRPPTSLTPEIIINPVVETRTPSPPKTPPPVVPGQEIVQEPVPEPVVRGPSPTFPPSPQSDVPRQTAPQPVIPGAVPRTLSPRPPQSPPPGTHRPGTPPQPVIPGAVPRTPSPPPRISLHRGTSKQRTPLPVVPGPVLIPPSPRQPAPPQPDTRQRTPQAEIPEAIVRTLSPRQPDLPQPSPPRQITPQPVIPEAVARIPTPPRLESPQPSTSRQRTPQRVEEIVAADIRQPDRVPIADAGVPVAGAQVQVRDGDDEISSIAAEDEEEQVPRPRRRRIRPVFDEEIEIPNYVQRAMRENNETLLTRRNITDRRSRSRLLQDQTDDLMKNPSFRRDCSMRNLDFASCRFRERRIAEPLQRLYTRHTSERDQNRPRPAARQPQPEPEAQAQPQPQAQPADEQPQGVEVEPTQRPEPTEIEIPAGRRTEPRETETIVGRVSSPKKRSSRSTAFLRDVTPGGVRGSGREIPEVPEFQRPPEPEVPDLQRETIPEIERVSLIRQEETGDGERSREAAGGRVSRRFPALDSAAVPMDISVDQQLVQSTAREAPEIQPGERQRTPKTPITLAMEQLFGSPVARLVQPDQLEQLIGTPVARLAQAAVQRPNLENVPEQPATLPRPRQLQGMSVERRNQQPWFIYTKVNEPDENWKLFDYVKDVLAELWYEKQENNERKSITAREMLQASDSYNRENYLTLVRVLDKLSLKREVSLEFKDDNVIASPYDVPYLTALQIQCVRKFEHLDDSDKE